MARRRPKRRTRQAEQRKRWPNVGEPEAFAPRIDALLASTMEERRPDPSTCGGCLEFLEDENAGRGACLHPGSGIVAPWSDTAACEFFVARRWRPRGAYAWDR